MTGPEGNSEFFGKHRDPPEKKKIIVSPRDQSLSDLLYNFLRRGKKENEKKKTV